MRTDGIARTPGDGARSRVARFLCICRRRPIVHTAVRVALVVGSLLNAINQGQRLVAGEGVILWQVVLNYVVPYCVSTYSAARLELRRQQEREGEYE